MNAHQETTVTIDFHRGIEITPTIVMNGEEQESVTFSNKTHQLEELLEFISYAEIECDVYL